MEYLKQVFLGLESTYKADSNRLATRACQEKLRPLAYVKFVPVVNTVDSGPASQAVCYNSTSNSPDWYVIDSLKLESSFREQVWLLDFPMETTQTLRPFLKTMDDVFGNAHPGLTLVVKESSQHTGKSADCPTLTQSLRSRSAYLGR